MMMTTPSITTRQADAIVELVASLRLDWDKAGIRTACRNAAEISGNPSRLAVAAVLAAANAANLTPAIIGMRGPHWDALDPARDREPPRAGGRCPDCGGLHGTGPHDPPEPTRSTRTPEHIAALRAELAQARTRLCPHGVPRHSCADHRKPPTEQPTEETA